MATNRIKKIQLADGSIYSIFDEGALRLSDPDSEGNSILLTGNPSVDNIILQTGLEIDLVDDVPLSVLNPEVVFRDPTTGKLLKLSLEQAQIKLGIKRYALKESSGVLSLGAQNVSGGAITDATFI